MPLAILYFFYTARGDFCEIFAPKFLPSRYINKRHTRRWKVTTGIIAGVTLVFLLLAYLVYALIHAEAF